MLPKICSGTRSAIYKMLQGPTGDVARITFLAFVSRYAALASVDWLLFRLLTTLYSDNVNASDGMFNPLGASLRYPNDLHRKPQLFNRNGFSECAHTLPRKSTTGVLKRRTALKQRAFVITRFRCIHSRPNPVTGEPLVRFSDPCVIERPKSR